MHWFNTCIAQNRLPEAVQAMKKVAAFCTLARKRERSHWAHVLNEDTDFDILFALLDRDLLISIQAHGINKGEPLDLLMDVLDRGIDATKTLYTWPLAVKDEDISAVQGFNGGNARYGWVHTNGPFILCSRTGWRISNVTDVSCILVDTPYIPFIPYFQKKYQTKYPWLQWIGLADEIKKGVTHTNTLLRRVCAK
jgi:hypothetical protein